MNAAVRNLLYDEPWLYDVVFPDAEDTMGRMCREAFVRFLPSPPRSVLDIGCGTGRHLESLSRSMADCWGVDSSTASVDYARRVRPSLRIEPGDMRAARLGRTFDLVTSFGNALSYALTDDDLSRTVKTFAAHAHPGTLLIVDVLNARCYLEGGGFRERIEGTVDTPSFKATSVSVHALDRDARLLRRTRRWHIPGRPDVEDYAEYRLVYPEELRGWLEGAGFRVVGMYDNRGFEMTTLDGAVTGLSDVSGMRGRKLYTFARKS
ncbi:MAG TPA: class I SAM-dependent methyltransferase [Candidatus Bathyarchaeia archaeon]|nr:class I SAM-dependent methyltransferase [Candidatus Bathyarchaeia archaeon]